jgi:glycosyltransferase involved in cell wall biosynthesis
MINIGIVLFHKGAFGGATKRFANLYAEILIRKNEITPFFFVNKTYYQSLKVLMPNLNFENVIVINVPYLDDLSNDLKKCELDIDIPKQQSIKSLIKIIFKRTVFRKIILYFKYRNRQKEIFKQLDSYKELFSINLFMGVYSGIWPLYFYFLKKKCPPIIYCNMDSWFQEIYLKRNDWYLKYNSFNLAFASSNKLDILSPYILKGLIDRGFNIPGEKISITANSFADYSKCEIGDKSVFKVAFASRLHPLKNPMLYLEVVKHVVEKYDDIYFYLLGDGILKEEIEKFIFVNNLSRYLKFLFHEQPETIFAETSVFLSLQQTNNYPSQSVLEAMACGNAIIATDVGDTRMFINENNGILVNFDSVQIAQAIERLYLNRDYLKSLGLYARKYVIQNQSQSKCVTYYENLFKSMF